VLRLPLPLAAQLSSSTLSVAAHVVALDGHVLTVSTEPGALATHEGALRLSLEAFGTTWECARLHVEKSDGAFSVLATDDAYDEATLWDLFFHARTAHGHGPATALDAAGTEIPFRGHFTREKAERRMAWLRERTGHPLPGLTSPRFDPAQLQGNIEQFAGSIEIPVGLVGPLLFVGEHVRGHVVAPFATTEGALVASASRGAKALTFAGGVKTHVIHQRMTRAPVFVMKDVNGATRLGAWMLDHTPEIRARAEAASRHARLVNLETVQIGRYLHVRFIYETGDAAGQNMATICTWRACAWIKAQLPFVRDLAVEHFFIEGNTSGDKKVSHLNAQAGRGIRVTAEAYVPRTILKRVLNVSPEILLDALEAGVTGSSYAGMTGVNVNVANAIAAIFTATGQDIACVHESSVAQFHLKAHDDGVVATLLLHALVVGTVGGGTWLPTQSDALRVLGCLGAGRVRRLAEIVAGFALGLELSTLSAVAAGDFVAAHEVLGRPRNDAGLRDADLDAAFFTARFAESGSLGEGTVTALEATPLEAPDGDSVLGQLVAGRTRKKLGLFPYAVHATVGGRAVDVKLALKSKPRDTEVVQAMTSLTRMCGDPIATLYETHGMDVGFRNCHLRELRVAELRDPRFTAIAPRTYFTYAQDPTADDPRAIYLLGMEYLDDMRLMGTADDPAAWRTEDIELAIDGIAAFHAIHLGKTDALAKEPWIDVATPQRMQRLAPLFEAVVEHNRIEQPDVYTDARATRMLHWLRDVRTQWEALERAPRTLVHNDFNPRNLALRPPHASGGARLCAFDWELATVHAPQRDVCELLAWVLPAGAPKGTRERFVEHHRRRLEHHSGLTLPKDEFDAVYDLCCMDYAVTRLGMYTVAHGFRAFDWLKRVLETHFASLDEA
jgi:hydroxymethylglutaryl-CoA reductase (NADPH)